MYRFNLSFIILLVSSLVSACSVGPDYIRPSVQIPASYKELDKSQKSKNWKIAEPQDACRIMVADF